MIMSDNELPAATAFYDHIDEVLGPPPGRLYRYGSGVMLFVLLLLAGVGLLLTVRQGIEGRAVTGSDQGREVMSPAEAARVRGVSVRNGDTVRVGDVLAIFDKRGTPGAADRLSAGDKVGAASAPGAADTLRAALAGIVKCQRQLTPGTIVPGGRPLFLITGLQTHYMIRIALLPLGYPAPAPDMDWIGKKVILQPEGEASVISDPYPDSALKYWVVDAEGAPARRTDVPAPSSGPAPVRPDGPAFIITGRKSLIRDLLGL